MFEQTFKNIDNVLWKEAGSTTELDYAEQTSWILFLKYLDELEEGREIEAELRARPYASIIDEAHRWGVWAATKPVATALEKAIDLIVPMVSLEAELFATVDAAWNNLIRDGVPITDDAIVKDARDDWHKDKLKIPEHKFRATIRQIRSTGFVPDGTAEYVASPAKLL